MIPVIYSCENAQFLEKKPFSVISTSNFYDTETDFKLALNGCYETLNSSSITGRWMPKGTFAFGLYPVFEGCSDVVVAVQNNEVLDFVKGNFLPTAETLDIFWSAFYAGISRCNYLLEKIEHKDFDSKTQIIAETRFMRAFYYYYLAVSFGGVPVITSPNTDLFAPRDNIETVFNLIINDLTYAYQNSSESAINESGANKWTAGAFLGIVYNYLSSCKRFHVGEKLLVHNSLNSFAWVDEDFYSNRAVEVLADVITNGNYELLPREQYTYLFRESTKSFQYLECLFLSEWSENQTDAFLTRAYFFVPMGANTYGGSYGYYIPTYNLYDAYAKEDIRRSHNITGQYDKNSTIETIQNVEYYVPAVGSLTSNLSFWQVGKFRAAKPGTFPSMSPHQSCINYPLIRLADVYLQYAEALYFTGNESEARKQFNIVRERVIDTTVISLDALNSLYYKSDFVEELLDERMRELCFESKRRIDLMRFEKTTDAINGLIPNKGSSNQKLGVELIQSNWQYHKIWLPIPQSQLDLNANLEQNVGYSGEVY